jgi:hypothetical protein
MTGSKAILALLASGAPFLRVAFESDALASLRPEQRSDTLTSQGGPVPLKDRSSRIGPVQIDVRPWLGSGDRGRQRRVRGGTPQGAQHVSTSGYPRRKMRKASHHAKLSALKTNLWVARAIRPAAGRAVSGRPREKCEE